MQIILIVGFYNMRSYNSVQAERSRRDTGYNTRNVFKFEGYDVTEEDEGLLAKIIQFISNFILRVKGISLGQGIFSFSRSSTRKYL